MTHHLSLADLGWQPFFQQQLSLEDWEHLIPARIVERHRSEIEVLTESNLFSLAITHSMPDLTVGDWLLLSQDGSFVRALERKSCFRRRAAGNKADEQLIAANVDTAFIVCSLNDDFNLNRIERYLAVVNEAGAEPVIVLSKMDLCADPDSFKQQIHRIDPMLSVELVNGLDIHSVDSLKSWCGKGKSVVLLGSSGTGKSTITNSLLEEERQQTGGIRMSDDKGRHTTTRRSLLPIANGGLLIDTPGMREIQLTNCQEGIASTFAEIEALAQNCRFSDCSHSGEPGCYVTHSIQLGELSQRRLDNYQKLSREQAYNSASLAERRAKDRELGRFYKRIQRKSKINKRGE
ncbi:ribosome small subunit-dependent GTPase A [Hahella sp. CCB-MM4]|uniref:ribosome small subunit-dependent GTPase A n=1 Tax=Hahella sp. (strain CCB-MM4) TaxID=1926491 RepID=UPI000BCF5F40|nr:ribosome small subunit-dependent GTPase A [Hahella sp. CCB-MM4]OZG70142.1 ribosome small subunit-dependent GTPase A [Hahella sp. CCB-MM4]